MPKETKDTPASPSLEELNETLRILEEEAIDKDERIANLEATVSKLSVKTQATATTPLPVIKIDKKSYQITLPALFVDGKKLTAEDIANDPEVQAHLLEIQSSALKAL